MLLLILLAVSGCPPAGKQNGTSGQQTTGQTPPAPAAQPGGAIALPLELAVDDPRVKALDFSDHHLFALARCIGLPLVRSTPDGTLLPGLASAWEMSADALTWSFTDNTPPDAPPAAMPPGGQVSLWVKHLEALLRGPDTPLRAQAADLIAGAADFRDGKALDISGVRLNINTLTVTLTRPNRVFGLWLSQPGLALVIDASLPTAGYGPFRIDHQEGNTLVLKPNAASLVGQPLLRELRFVCQPDRAQQLAMFRAGQLDAANLSPVDAATAQYDTQLADALTVQQTAASVVGFFDLHEFPWGEGQFQSKVGLRQAANWGLDREYLGTSQNGQLAPWPHFLPQAFQRYIDPQYVQQPPYPLHPEIEKARAGLKLADHDQGIKLPQGMDVMYLHGEYLDSLAENIVQYLAEISIKMRPFDASPQDLAKRLDIQTNEIILARLYPAYPDVDALFYPALHSSLYGRGGNWALLKDAAVDKALADGQALADAQARELNYRKLGADMEARALALFVGYSTPTLLINPQLAGYTLTPYDYDASLPAQDFAQLGLAK